MTLFKYSYDLINAKKNCAYPTAGMTWVSTTELWALNTIDRCMMTVAQDKGIAHCVRLTKYETKQLQNTQLQLRHAELPPLAFKNSRWSVRFWHAFSRHWVWGGVVSDLSFKVQSARQTELKLSSRTFSVSRLQVLIAVWGCWSVGKVTCFNASFLYLWCGRPRFSGNRLCAHGPKRHFFSAISTVSWKAIKRLFDPV